jgi:hypothetical protein
MESQYNSLHVQIKKCVGHFEISVQITSQATKLSTMVCRSAAMIPSAEGEQGPPVKDALSSWRYVTRSCQNDHHITYTITDEIVQTHACSDDLRLL